MNNYKIRKVFNCQEMPDDLKEQFFAFVRESFFIGNDCYIGWSVNATNDPDDVQIAVDKWLTDNGANPGSENIEGEEVLISHWW